LLGYDLPGHHEVRHRLVPFYSSYFLPFQFFILRVISG
jgi:hypothetical protein